MQDLWFLWAPAAVLPDVKYAGASSNALLLAWDFKNQHLNSKDPDGSDQHSGGDVLGLRPELSSLGPI